MMKMRKDEFYRILLNETINKEGFNPDFISQTNQYNISEKKRLISLLYDKLRVSKKKYGKNYEEVSKCPDETIHKVFEKLFNEALKAKEKGLLSKINSDYQLEFDFMTKPDKKSDFERHLGALDGDGYFIHNYPAYFSK
jgi:hypothetical protein